MMPRHQTPARSPIGARALGRGLLQVPALGRDPRDELLARLIARFHADGAALHASGTQALEFAFRALRAYQDAPVLLPAYTCYEVATAAVGAGVRVALYDIDPDTLEPDEASVRAAARQGAAAIVVSPLYGMPLDWLRARFLADQIGALLIEDAAQANGSMWQGRPVGCVGDLSILSFGRGKGWTGQGGGALLWRGTAASAVALQTNSSSAGGPFGSRDPGVAGEARTAAMAVAQWLLGRPALYAIPASVPGLHLGETHYHEPRPAAPMRRVSAALVLANDDAAQAEAAARRENARDYVRLLGQASEPVPNPIGARVDDDSGALRFPLRLAGGWANLRLTEAPRLGAAAGYPDVLNSLPALHRQIADPDVSIPGATLLARELVTLPTHSGTSQDERERLARLVAPAARAATPAGPALSRTDSIASAVTVASPQQQAKGTDSRKLT